MVKKYGFVYIWFDRKHVRFYIGSHWGSVDDGYICSSRWMRKSFKRRPEDFKRRIITKVYTSRKELLEVEHKYLQMIDVHELGKKYYNLTNHLNGHWTTDENKSLTIKEKISIKTKEAMQRPEVKEKYKEGLKTRDTRKSDECIRRHSEAMVKYWQEKSPVENRQTWLDKNSEELKEIHRNNTKTLWENPEYRAKVVRKCKPFTGDGIKYESLTEAARNYNLTPCAIKHRIKSDNFPTWYYN